MQNTTRNLLVTFIFSLLLIGCTNNSNDPTNGDAVVEKEYEQFDPTQFANPTVIDNQWFPLKPGMEWIFEGQTTEDGETVPHRVIMTVTDLTKMIDGIEVVVIWDQDFAEDELVEAEIAFFAQDDAGNVWHFGQYPEEYENGDVIDAPGWVAGRQDARPGIHIKATHELNSPSYSQGWGPSVGWTDRTQLYSMGESVCVSTGCYDNVLVMDEYAKEEPNAFQLKYYAPNVGYVKVGWRGEDATAEEMELISVGELDAAGMTIARDSALALEERAYLNISEAFGDTGRATVSE